MSDAFFQLQKTITEVGQLQARLIAENKRLRNENERLRNEKVASVIALGSEPQSVHPDGGG